eukprot:c6623_g1_i3.p1 GENE.c6623_g1_i3~~c6623_g1_i3.p1  ORF type:complete len:182 (+),score=26.17 c6623_g1_i3:1-546(+)
MGLPLNSRMEFQAVYGNIPVDLVILDCDGVIFDSNSLKTQAYATCLRHMNVPEEKIAEYVALHTRDASVAREIKFGYFFKNIYPVEDVERAIQEAVKGYVKECDLVYDSLEPLPEALELARICSHAHVVSGTAEAELQIVFQNHKIDQLFRSIRGTPTKKQTHITDIISVSVKIICCEMCV